ncbi:CsbD family protein [Terracidiphilus gabretensis]|uniref:CsbD family protein n=1 Tax=Terracidiphilus gabretensis TaxID=1577687 RepID=UPI00071B68AA|nr:CsbD family protein [Terracidiphilus gabretensis]
MNTDQVKGKAEQVVGKIKQGTGQAVGNDKLANSGVADQVKGAARETWGNVKDAAQSEHKEHANHARDRVVEKTEELKERANESIDKHKR